MNLLTQAAIERFPTELTPRVFREFRKSVDGQTYGTYTITSLADTKGNKDVLLLV